MWMPQLIACAVLICASPSALVQDLAGGEPKRTVILDAIWNSWDIERNETLVYLRVYSDGLAIAHPMRKVDFRNIGFKKKQLSDEEMKVLRELLSQPETTRLARRYYRFWGGVDFGYKYTLTNSFLSKSQVIELENFQPFLAREKGKPYPAQVERLGCTVWKLRVEVSGERLDKNYLEGCTELGY